MKSTWRVCLAAACVAASLAGARAAHSEETPAASADNSEAQGAEDNTAGAARYSVEVARDRAKIMHEVYVATLDAVHHHYFRGERAVVPARAMEDVFDAVKQGSNIEARWISVSLKPMSITHEPKSDFEKKAAQEIAAGKPHYEEIADGVYRRAGAIPMENSCISCHVGFFNKPGTSPKFAGLVISMPVHDSGAAETSP
ncbi:MAG: DUF3365 domain-containing protein [Planctomycetales bacterium]|nr:DUF3365 domain-containing protein [Planctomycetales bacterium]